MNYGVPDHFTPEEAESVDKHLSAFAVPLGFLRLAQLRNQYIRMLPRPGLQRKGKIAVSRITRKDRHGEGEQTQANDVFHRHRLSACRLYTPCD